jgi:hypothetical protein
MASTANSIAGLVVDPELQHAWQAAVPGGKVVGIAGASASSLGTVVAVSATPVDDAAVAVAAPGLAEALGVRAVQVVVTTGSTLAELVRDWTYQAAQGSGRGVHVRVLTEEAEEAEEGTRAGAVRVLVRSIDSSARELAFRLASPQEPALPALRALLSGREVTVADEESSPQ